MPSHEILLSSCFAVFPDYRSPLPCDTGSGSHEVVPCRVPPPPSSPSRRSASTSRVSSPTTTSLGLAPYGAGIPNLPRFRSQAFSASQRFPSSPKFHGLISCRNRSWGSPFRVFPSQKAVPPLEGRCSLRLSTDVLKRTTPVLITAGFPDSHASDAVAWFPRRL